MNGACTRYSMSAFACSAVVLICTGGWSGAASAGPTSAGADDDVPADATRGGLPQWGVAPAGGLLLRGYQAPDSLGSLSETKIDGLFGLTGTVQVDLGTRMAIVGESTISFPGAYMIEGNAGLLYGFRHWGQYRELQSSTRVDAYTIENTYKVYEDKYVPTVFGLYAGAGLFAAGSDTAESFAVDNPPVMLPALQIPTLEFGFAVAGGFGGMIAGVVDPTSGSWGGRLRFDGTYGGGSLALHYGTQMFIISVPDGSGPIFHATAYIGLGGGPHVL